MADAQIRSIAHAWMRHLGFTDEQIAVAETHSCADTCERIGDAWDCTDEHGESRHPLADMLSAAAEMANVALEAIQPHGTPIGYVTGYRDNSGWHIEFDGAPFTYTEAIDDLHDAATSMPNAAWHALEVRTVPNA